MMIKIPGHCSGGAGGQTYQVKSAKNGGEALDVLDRERIAVVVLNVGCSKWAATDSTDCCKTKIIRQF